MPRRLVSWPPLKSFAFFLVLSCAAHAETPISTTTGSDEMVRALAFPQQGGFLLLAWMHTDAVLGTDLQWKLFGGSFQLGDTLPARGLPLVTSPGSQGYPALAPVASAGCIPGSLCPSTVVVYDDDKPEGLTLRAKRFGDATSWDVLLSDHARSPAAAITSDGSTGAIVCWLEGDSVQPRAQRLGGDGTKLWGPSGVPVTIPTHGTGTDIKVASDGEGGAFIVWADLRNDPDLSIVATHLGPDGGPVQGWPAEGRVIRTSANLPQGQDVLADGGAGAFILWSEFDSLAVGGLGLHPRVVRIHPDGSLVAGWVATGNPVAPRPDSPCYVWQFVSDGAGGVLVALTSITAGGKSRAMVQRLSGDGSRPAGWPAGGLDACSAPGENFGPVVVGRGGTAYLVWEDTRLGDLESDVYAARFLADGSRAPGWPADGLPICVAPSIQRPQVVGLDAGGDAIIVWLDMRNRDSEADIWGEVVSEQASVSVPAPVVTRASLAITSANPAREAVRGEFTLDAPEHVRLEVHDVAGRCIARLADRVEEAGRHPFMWRARDASDSPMPAGVYFVSLHTASAVRTQTVVVTR